jgi:hypothetical protein
MCAKESEGNFLIHLTNKLLHDLKNTHQDTKSYNTVPMKRLITNAINTKTLPECISHKRWIPLSLRNTDTQFNTFSIVDIMSSAMQSDN